MSLEPAPLDGFGSIRTKLGVLVGASVVASAALVALAGLAEVPWWLSVPVAVGIALALTQLLAVGMTAPLRDMTAAAERMSRGDYRTRVRATSGDEVGELARAFNAMAADLEAVDRQRRELIANVAHELRTPLAGLSATIENMADGVVPADQSHLSQTRGQVERLSALVADLLDLSRTDAGVTPLKTAQIRVADLVAEVAGEVGVERLETRFVPEDLTVTADPARLRQVLVNLIDNARRHSPAGGVVRVSAQLMPAGWRLEVADQGAGIAARDRAHVFERFGTADPEGGGTGLGLAITRWIVELHGGRVGAVDPLAGETGARIRVDLPNVPPVQGARPESPRGAPVPNTSISAGGVPMTITPTAVPGQLPAAAGQPGQPGRPLPPSVWPESIGPRRDVLLAALGVGLLAGLLLPYRNLGLGLSLVLLCAGGVVVWSMRERLRGFTLACVLLGIPLALVPMLRDAVWLTPLALLAAGALVAAGTTAGRTLVDFVYAALAWPAAAIRGLPWLARTLGVLRQGTGSVAVARTAVISLGLLLVFGLLFASADAVVGSWLDRIVPEFSINSTVFRTFVGLAFFGGTLTAAYLALNPLPMIGPMTTRPSTRRFEWLVPVLVVDAVFGIFLLAQAAVFFGGHAYLRRTTGLTYAEYVHQGFGQLTLATLLTLGVIGAAASRGNRQDRGDRLWLRISLGALCLLTLVVVASALYRMHLYQQAYGFTVLRLVVDVFEGWLGLLVVLIMVAGIGLRGGWVARAGLLTGAATVLGLALINPEAWIAQHNLDRYASTGKVDDYYLRNLSADAVPVVAGSAVADVGCFVRPDRVRPGDDLWEWNLGRVRARAAWAGGATVNDEACGRRYGTY